MDLNLVHIFFFVWRCDFCHQESRFDGQAVRQLSIGFKPKREAYKFGDGHRSFIREDHANNLRLKACLLTYNWHVRLLLKIKKRMQ